MATQNVKILLRRGLREQLTADVLDTGELGFTTDTNQLFVGIDSAINEVQFDPFVNAHAVIQSWLDSDDCPEEGLIVDEDLVIRNIDDMERFLSAMHFYTQTVVLDTDYDISVGDSLYQREYIFSDNAISLEKLFDENDEFVINPGGTYRIDVIGDTDNETFNFLENTAFGNKIYKTGDIFEMRQDVKAQFDALNDRVVTTETPTLTENGKLFQLDVNNLYPEQDVNKLFSKVQITYTQNVTTSPVSKILEEGVDYELDVSGTGNVTILADDIDIDSREDLILVEYIDYVDWGNALLTEITSVRSVADGTVRTVTPNPVTNTTTVVVSIYEGKPYFIKDTSYGDANDYHFYGTTKQAISSINGSELTESTDYSVNPDIIAIPTADQDGIKTVLHNIFDLENIQNYVIVSKVTTNAVTGETELTRLDTTLAFVEDTDVLQIETLDIDAKGAESYQLEYPILDTSDGLTTVPGLFKYDGTEWVKQSVTIVDSVADKEYDDRLNVTIVDGIVTPIHEADTADNAITHGSVGDYVMVTSNDTITYWVKREHDWKMLGKKFEISDDVLININSDTHNIPSSIQTAYIADANHEFKVVITENVLYENRMEYELSADNYNIDFDNWTITFNFPFDGSSDGEFMSNPKYFDADKFEDKIRITYSYSSDDFQFSSNPPVEYTNQDDTYYPLETRSNGEALIDGDHYIYTDKDFDGGINLNIFEWSQFGDTLAYTEDDIDEKVGYNHDNIPLFNSDTEATDLLKTNSKIYGRLSSDNVAMIELRKREYVSSNFWNRYDFKSDKYYFSKNPVAKVDDPDLTQAIDISGASQFSAAFMGRARRNVEVVTENTFLQLFSDQHLSAEYGHSGMRPSLFRKIFIDTEGTFLRYNKNICTTFFVDYSLKQTDGTRTYIRVGTLQIINGVPHGIEQVKLTDNNTEIWQDDGDGIVEDANDNEFSNIEFSTDIVGNNIEIKYTQHNYYKTEVSYTIKRWTM